MTRDEAWKLADHWIASWNAHDLDLIMTHYEDAIELTSPVVAQLLGTLGRWHELWRTTVLSRRDPAHAREKSQLINALAVTVACWREADFRITSV